jgi:hypothetical protein
VVETAADLRARAASMGAKSLDTSVTT